MCKSPSSPFVNWNYRWVKATSIEEQLLNLYSKLKDFHETLHRSAIRHFSDKVKVEATGVALKGYALGSLIADRGFLLRCAIMCQRKHQSLALAGSVCLLSLQDNLHH